MTGIGGGSGCLDEEGGWGRVGRWVSFIIVESKKGI